MRGTPDKEYTCSICGRRGHNKTTCGKGAAPKDHHRAPSPAGLTQQPKPSQNRPLLTQVINQENFNDYHTAPDTATHFPSSVPESSNRFKGSHVGELGSPVTLVGKVKFTKAFSSSYSFYGSSKLVVVDVQGSEVSFYSSANWVFDEKLPQGTPIAIEGIVEKHDIFSDTKQTRLKKVKLLKRSSLPEDEIYEEQ